MSHQFNQYKHYERPTYCSQTLNPQIQLLPPPSFVVDNDYIFMQATKVKQRLSKINNKNYQTLSNSFKYSSIQNQPQSKNKNKQNLSLNIKQLSSSLQKQKCIKNLQRQKCIKNVYVQQGRLLKRVTIHRIRSQRDSIQNSTKKMENSFNYITNTLAKRQKIQRLKFQKQVQIQKVRTQQIKNRQMCSKQIVDAQKQHMKHKIQLKNSVVEQKIKTQQSVKKIINQNFLKALQLKSLSQKNEQFIFQRESRIKQHNKIMYEIQKQQEVIRSQNHKHNLDAKRMEARQRFKQKWLSQYQKNSKSRHHYKKQKSLIQSKLKSILSKYESGQLVDMADKHNGNRISNVGWSKNNKISAYNKTNKHTRISFFQELN